MADGKAQIEKTISVCKESSARMAQLQDSGDGQADDAKKRMSDILYTLEGIQNKVFFKTKASLSFTIPTLSAAERLQEALEGSDSNGVEAVLDELDGLESNVDVLKVKVANQDIILT